MEAQQVKSTRSPWVLGAVAVVVGLVIGAVAAVVFWPEGSGAEAVRLERSDAAGDDPFMESVQTGEVPVIEQPAVDAASAVRAELPQDDATAVLVATGTEPGLYGGSGDAQVCDAAKLVAYLDENPDKAQAFSDVLDITPEGIGDYVASLTPVVLLSDTLVTNHGFEDGQATAFTSVLQAGTAVMVDQQGVPRVKCNCGNPLTEPEVVPSSDWDVRGDAWDGYDAASVTGVVAGDTVEEITLCDLVTGERYTIPVGSTPTDGTEPPDIEGEWTIELRNPSDLMTPLTPGRLEAICPTVDLDGAVLVIRGTRASIDDPEFGEWEGTVEGAPQGSPEWLNAIQRSVNGAVIEMRPVREDIPVLTFNVATSRDGLSGLINVTVQDRYPPCDVGVVATRAGSTPTATAPTSTTSTPTPSTTAPSTPAGPTAGSGGPCGAGTLIGVVRGYVSDPIVGFTVERCNERWALVTYGVNDQDDVALLEWNGSTWITGACQKYRDPSDWTTSPVVPPEYWMACIVD